MEKSMKEFFASENINDDFQIKNLQNASTTDKLLEKISSQLEKIINKNKIQPYNSGPTNLPNAVITRPTDPDNIDPVTGYTQIRIRSVLERKADILYIINNGPGNIFVITVKWASTISQSEYQIFEGDRGTFYDVDEIRLRATTANTEYIATENELIRPKDIRFLRGNPYVSEQTLAAGATRTENVVTSAVPPLGLGRNAHTGYIINDGAGNMTMQLSSDGVTYALPATLIPNQTVNFEDSDIYSIIFTNVAGGNSYRLNIH